MEVVEDEHDCDSKDFSLANVAKSMNLPQMHSFGDDDSNGNSFEQSEDSSFLTSNDADENDDSGDDSNGIQSEKHKWHDILYYLGESKANESARPGPTLTELFEQDDVKGLLTMQTSTAPNNNSNHVNAANILARKRSAWSNQRKMKKLSTRKYSELNSQLSTKISNPFQDLDGSNDEYSDTSDSTGDDDFYVQRARIRQASKQQSTQLELEAKMILTQQKGKVYDNFDENVCKSNGQKNDTIDTSTSNKNQSQNFQSAQAEMRSKRVFEPPSANPTTFHYTTFSCETSPPARHHKDKQLYKTYINPYDTPGSLRPSALLRNKIGVKLSPHRGSASRVNLGYGESRSRNRRSKKCNYDIVNNYIFSSKSRDNFQSAVPDVEVVVIRDYDFSRRNIIVHVNTPIEFRLHDQDVPLHVEHVLEGRSLERDLCFLSPILQHPDSAAHRIVPTCSGEIYVRCQIYTDMTCRILVLPQSHVNSMLANGNARAIHSKAPHLTSPTSYKGQLTRKGALFNETKLATGVDKAPANRSILVPPPPLHNSFFGVAEVRAQIPGSPQVSSVGSVGDISDSMSCYSLSTAIDSDDGTIRTRSCSSNVSTPNKNSQGVETRYQDILGIDESEITINEYHDDGQDICDDTYPQRYVVPSYPHINCNSKSVNKLSFGNESGYAYYDAEDENENSSCDESCSAMLSTSKVKSNDKFADTVYVEDFRFQPSQLTVEQGSSIRFVSVSHASVHKLTCSSNGSRKTSSPENKANCHGGTIEFENRSLESNSKHKEFVHTFSTLGKFVVINEIFSFMSCEITVVSPPRHQEVTSHHGLRADKNFSNGCSPYANFHLYAADLDEFVSSDSDSSSFVSSEPDVSNNTIPDNFDVSSAKRNVLTPEKVNLKEFHDEVDAVTEEGREKELFYAHIAGHSVTRKLSDDAKSISPPTSTTETTAVSLTSSTSSLDTLNCHIPLMGSFVSSPGMVSAAIAAAGNLKFNPSNDSKCFGSSVQGTSHAALKAMRPNVDVTEDLGISCSLLVAVNNVDITALFCVFIGESDEKEDVVCNNTSSRDIIELEMKLLEFERARDRQREIDAKLFASSPQQVKNDNDAEFQPLLGSGNVVSEAISSTQPGELEEKVQDGHNRVLSEKALQRRRLKNQRKKRNARLRSQSQEISEEDIIVDLNDGVNENGIVERKQSDKSNLADQDETAGAISKYVDVAVDINCTTSPTQSEDVVVWEDYHFLREEHEFQTKLSKREKRQRQLEQHPETKEKGAKAILQDQVNQSKTGKSEIVVENKKTRSQKRPKDAEPCLKVEKKEKNLRQDGNGAQERIERKRNVMNNLLPQGLTSIDKTTDKQLNAKIKDKKNQIKDEKVDEIGNNFRHQHQHGAEPNEKSESDTQNQALVKTCQFAKSEESSPQFNTKFNKSGDDPMPLETKKIEDSSNASGEEIKMKIIEKNGHVKKENNHNKKSKSKEGVRVSKDNPKEVTGALNEQMNAAAPSSSNKVPSKSFKSKRTTSRIVSDEISDRKESGKSNSGLEKSACSESSQSAASSTLKSTAARCDQSRLMGLLQSATSSEELFPEQKKLSNSSTSEIPMSQRSTNPKRYVCYSDSPAEKNIEQEMLCFFSQRKIRYVLLLFLALLMHAFAFT